MLTLPVKLASEPMKSYLRTAVGLLRDGRCSRIAGRGKGTDDLFKNLTADEMDQPLEMAAGRWPADLDEAAKVIDIVSAPVDGFIGVATDDVLTSLDLLEAELDVEGPARWGRRTRRRGRLRR